MIHTFAEAEFPIPADLAIQGTTAWVWAELVLEVPYFIVKLELDNGDVRRNKHLLCVDISTVARLDEMSGEGVKIRHLSALCPGSMAKSSTYRMEDIVEVWESPDRPEDQIFITADGRSMRFCTYEVPTPRERMQCVFRIGNRVVS